MAASTAVAAQIGRLVTLFNARSLDLPDGLFTRQTQWMLNGVPFEQLLGRSPGDPLVLMLARGPSGYRFAAKAVQHAVPDGMLQWGELSAAAAGDDGTLCGRCWLSGHLRGTGEPLELLVDVEFRFRGGAVESANAILEPSEVARLLDSRLRP